MTEQGVAGERAGIGWPEHVRARQWTRSVDDRHPHLGPSLYILGLQYFIIQVLVAIRFTPTYSVAHNTISDLGNTHCGTFNSRAMCSPLHLLMNLSFLVLGICMLVGSMLVYHRYDRSRSAQIGFGAFALGGLGVVLVGLFPENGVSALHGIGAALPFLIGNVGLVVLGVSLEVPRILRLVTLLAGVGALVALVFYASSLDLGLGDGGIERVVAYPQTLWMIVIGAYSLGASRAAL